MTLGTTLLSLVRSQMAAQLEGCRCPVLCILAPKFELFPYENCKTYRPVFPEVKVLVSSRNYAWKTGTAGKNRNNSFVWNDLNIGNVGTILYISLCGL